MKQLMILFSVYPGIFLNRYLENSLKFPYNAPHG